MSVPVGERDEGRFTLDIKAEKLLRYTLEITANEGVFIPDFRKTVTDDIILSAKNVYLFIRDANDTHVRMGTSFQPRDWAERNAYQREALRYSRRLLYLIDIAHRVFHLSGKRVKYWGSMTVEVRNRIQGWMDADTKRYHNS